MDKQFVFDVGEEFDGYRLDKWLSVVACDFSRSKIQQFIENACLCKNGVPVTVRRENVKAGEQYILTVPDEKVDTLMKPENIPLDILYEDDDIIVVNKPAGMVVHQGRRASINSKGS